MVSSVSLAKNAVFASLQTVPTPILTGANHSTETDTKLSSRPPSRDLHTKDRLRIESGMTTYREGA